MQVETPPPVSQRSAADAGDDVVENETEPDCTAAAIMLPAYITHVEALNLKYGKAASESSCATSFLGMLNKDKTEPRSMKSVLMKRAGTNLKAVNIALGSKEAVMVSFGFTPQLAVTAPRVPGKAGGAAPIPNTLFVQQLEDKFECIRKSSSERQSKLEEAGGR